MANGITYISGGGEIAVSNMAHDGYMPLTAKDFVTYDGIGLRSLKDGLEKYDVLTDTPTALEIPLSSYRVGGIIKAIYIAGTHTKDWVAGQTYPITTRGGIYAPKISWSKRIIYKYVSGSQHYAVLAMDTNGVITISPETVAYGGTMRIFETYF